MVVFSTCILAPGGETGNHSSDFKIRYETHPGNTVAEISKAKTRLILKREPIRCLPGIQAYAIVNHDVVSVKE